MPDVGQQLNDEVERRIVEVLIKGIFLYSCILESNNYFLSLTPQNRDASPHALHTLPCSPPPAGVDGRVGCKDVIISLVSCTVESEAQSWRRQPITWLRRCVFVREEQWGAASCGETAPSGQRGGRDVTSPQGRSLSHTLPAQLPFLYTLSPL